MEGFGTTWVINKSRETFALTYPIKYHEEWEPLTIFPKSSILDIIVGADYASGIYLNFLSRGCKTISANKDFSRCTFTELSVSNSESKSVTKLEVYSCKNEIFKDFVVKSIVEKGPAMIC